VTQAAQTAPRIVAAILKLRRKHPAWGPRKLRARLQLDDAKTKWPAASTIGDILKRAGLVRPRKLRRRVPPAQHPFRGAHAPNDVWCIDFKGFWKTGDGVRVLPFTVSDAMSRYLLVCQAVEHPDFDTVWPILVKAFKEYGLPRAIRSDNGPPFGAIAAGGLSRLAVNFVRMGITPERITPGKPQENGRHERMHQTLKREAATPPSSTQKAQLARLERFRQVFNEERPHEALGQIPPARVFTPSPRLWDGKLRSPAYWGATEVRTVRISGSIRWRGRELFVSEVLNGERIGIFWRSPIGASCGSFEQDGRDVRPRNRFTSKACFEELQTHEALVCGRGLERIPAGAADPENERCHQGLEEHLGRHADVMDDGLAAAGPGPERIVPEDAH
jgi:transposase InsO family protein